MKALKAGATGYLLKDTDGGKEAMKRANNELEVRVDERIAALNQSNEEMKETAFQLVWAEERERQRIASE